MEIEEEEREERLIEWPYDRTRMRIQRRNRFEKEEYARKYINYHMKDEIEDNKEFKQICKRREEESKKLLYSKGYAIPLKMYDEMRGEWKRIMYGDKEPSDIRNGKEIRSDEIKERRVVKKLYEMRRINLRERCIRRRKIWKELERWKVKVEKNTIPIDKRIIINLSGEEEDIQDKIISVTIRWISLMMGVEEIYLYNGIKGKIGYRYYSGEEVIIIIVENFKWRELNRDELYKIRKIMKKKSVEIQNESYELNNKWIIIMDITGQIECEGYKRMVMYDIITDDKKIRSKDIINKLKSKKYEETESIDTTIVTETGMEEEVSRLSPSI